MEFRKISPRFTHQDNGVTLWDRHYRWMNVLNDRVRNFAREGIIPTETVTIIKCAEYVRMQYSLITLVYLCTQKWLVIPVFISE